MSRFCPLRGKELGENTIDTASNVALKGKPLHNYHLKILNGLKLLMTLSKKKGEKDMISFKEKMIQNSSGTGICPGTSI